MSTKALALMHYVGQRGLKPSTLVIWTRSVLSHHTKPSCVRHFSNAKDITATKVWRVGKDKYENLPVKEYLTASWKIDVKKMKRRGNIRRIEALSIKEDIRPRLEILAEAGIEEEKFGHVLTREPTFLLQSIPDLLIRISTLQKIGIDKEEIPRIIIQSPNVLTNRIEVTLLDKIEFLKSVPVKPPLTGDNILDMLIRCPELMVECSLKAMVERMELFTETIMINKGQLRNLLVRQPQILTFSHAALYEKYKYYRDVMGLKKANIARCPRALMCSLRRVKERYNFLKSKGIIEEGQTLDDHGLGIIATYTDRNFAKAVKIPPETYKTFVETFWKEEAKKLKDEKRLRKKKKTTGYEDERKNYDAEEKDN